MEQAIDGEVFAELTLNGQSIPLINDAVITLWIVSAIIIGMLLFLTSRLTIVPGRKQAAAEMMYEFCRKFAKDQIGPHGHSYAAYLGTLLLLLGVSNMIALINIIPSGEFLGKLFNNPALEHFHFSLHPPTRNFNVTLCLALASMAVVIHAEFKYKGMRGWLETFYKPMPLFGFVKILDYIVRPMSLCLRLFGNILGAVIVMTLLYGMVSVPLLYPAVFGVYFDILDGGLQAFVFVFLTAVYLSEATESHDGAEHAEHA
jgi:F-type H+-transporting ATPase subunit a